MQARRFDLFGMQRLERAQADVQGDARDFRAARGQASRISPVKCRPAVGAATEPRSRANTVW